MAHIGRRRAVGRDAPRWQIRLDMAGQLGGLVVVRVQRVLSVLGSQRVDVHRSVRRLRRDVLVERVPGHALHKMTVLGDLAN